LQLPAPKTKNAVVWIYQPVINVSKSLAALNGTELGLYECVSPNSGVG